MKDSQSNYKFSPLSEDNGRAQPGRKMLCSRDAGWKSLLLQVIETAAHADPFEAPATPDQTVVLMIKGEYEIESFSSRSWKRALYRPGMGGLTAPTHTSRLRWHSSNPAVCQTLHLWIPREYVLEAVDEFSRAGRRRSVQALDTLAFEDPVITSIARMLMEQVRTGQPDLYADAAARFLSTHLLAKQERWSEDIMDRNPGSLTDARLARVLEFLRVNFSKPITLDELAREAGISRFHFSRVFKRAIGCTPQQYLVKLRLDHAALLLAQTELPVAVFASTCGYEHTGYFAAAFQKQFNYTPMMYRKRIRL